MLSSGELLSSRLVTSIRKPKIAKPHTFQQFATIQLDINAIRAGRISPKDHETLIKALQTISELVPHAKVTLNDLFLNDADQQTKELSKEFVKATKQKLVIERNKYLKKIKTKYGTESYKNVKWKLWKQWLI
jgi:glycosyltransferase involved in cell wall biosynthesis